MFRFKYVYYISRPIDLNRTIPESRRDHFLCVTARMDQDCKIAIVRKEVEYRVPAYLKIVLRPRKPPDEVQKKDI